MSAGYEDDEWDDDEWSEGDYYDDDDESETVECPECGKDVYEDAERCPYCGNYVVLSSRNVWKDKPVWWIVLGVLGIIAVIFALLPL